MKKISCLCLLFSILLHTVAADTALVASPGGKIQFRLLTLNGRPGFSVRSGNITVMEPSSLSMTVYRQELAINAKLGKANTCRINEKYDGRGCVFNNEKCKGSGYLSVKE